MESLPSKSDPAKPLGVPERAYEEPRLKGAEQRLGDHHGQIVTCTLDQLRPHPSYVRHQRLRPGHRCGRGFGRPCLRGGTYHFNELPDHHGSFRQNGF